MITELTVAARPRALQIPEDLPHNSDKRAEFFLELQAMGAEKIEYMMGDDFAIPHVSWYDQDGNPSVGFLGEVLVQWDHYPEIQVYSESRFFSMFQVAE
jgi:hypothetical protein